MTLRWLPSMICTLALVGCDELTDENIPIATLRGVLSLDDRVEAPEGNLRLSILWNNFNADISRGPGGCGANRVAVSSAKFLGIEQQLAVDIDTDFPAEFSVTLAEPPPRSATIKCRDNPNSRCAQGDLIVYRDVNGNGRLDQRSLDTKSPDEMLGSGLGTLPSNEDHGTRYQVAFSSRTQAMRDGATAEWGTGDAGYSLLIERTDLQWRRIDIEAQPLDANTEIELTLSPTPYVQHWACGESCDIKKEMECPTDPADLLVGDFGKPRTTEGLVGAALWERVDGELTITTGTRCERGQNDDGGNNAGREFFQFGRWTQEGCTRTFEGCRYERSQLPDGIDLPCTEYELVSF
jgi:hypothetical protein